MNISVTTAPSNELATTAAATVIRPSNRTGADTTVSPNSQYSSSTTTTSSIFSAPVFSDDLCVGHAALPPPAAIELLPRQGSVSSTKTCEVDLGDAERDSYSPLSISHNSCSTSPSDGDAADEICHAGTVPPSTLLRPIVAALVDNKIYDGSLGLAQAHSVMGNNKIVSSSSINTSNAATTTPSKEEKQRQNEEIVIMETSSVSSETGSWESVFPRAVVVSTVDLDVRNFCAEFLQHERLSHHPQCKPQEQARKQCMSPALREESYELHLEEPTVENLLHAEPVRERTYSTGAQGTTVRTVTADACSSLNRVGAFDSGSTKSSPQLRNDNVLSSSACFIDASTLRDEEEVQSFPSLDGQQSLVDDLNVSGMEIESYDGSHCDYDHVDDDVDSPTKQLETFHKSFAKCKTKAKNALEATKKVKAASTSSSSSSTSSSRSPHKVSTAPTTNNLSDEEKLWKREISSAGAQSQPPIIYIDSKDQDLIKNAQTTVDSPIHLLSTALEDATEASASLAADFDSSDSSEIVKFRLEQERRHTACSVIPQHQIPHQQAYNKQSFQSAIVSIAAQHSDLSYTTDYSSSSPAPSLVWSEREQRLYSGGVVSLQIAAHHQHSDDYDPSLQKSSFSLMPDTPHNSIAHINDVNLSGTSSILRDSTLSSCSQQRDSGAYCSDATESPIPMPRTPKRSKCDESNPIISGGSTIQDFAVKRCDSPLVKRRTDKCPIISGGFRSLDLDTTQPQANEDEESVEMHRKQTTTRKPISALSSSWIVDMSNCQSEHRKSNSSSASSAEYTQAARFRERTDSGSSTKSGCGFYVSLEHIEDKKENVMASNRKTKPCITPRPADFLLNMQQSKEINTASGNESKTETQEGNSERKNIFSMFIDFSEKKPSAGIKREPFNLAARLSSSFTSSTSSNTTSCTATSVQNQKERRIDEQARSGTSSTETLMSKSYTHQTQKNNDGAGMNSKSLDCKCNFNNSPITPTELMRIPKKKQSAQVEASKRHSWGNDGSCMAVVGSSNSSNIYKRSISLTSNGGNEADGKDGLMSIIDKLPLIAKTSNLSVDSSLSPYDDVLSSKSELSSCSNVSGGEEKFINNIKTKKRRRDVQINETFDKSSIASITDSVFSKDLSPTSTTDTDDLTFQQDEELASREAIQSSLPPPILPLNSARSSAIIMETILETKEISSPKKKHTIGHTMETLHATIEKQKQLLETVNEHGCVDALEKNPAIYVKLSDMDKPVRHDLHSPEATMSKSAGGTHRQMNRLFRDEALKASSAAITAATSSRPHSWTMMTRSTGNAFLLNITTSMDNLRSLSRIFPNFSKEFSSSLPNGIILDRQIDDYIQTDMSADSSLASSFSRSGMDESSISCRQPRRLGEDLLKMFLQEIATDMFVEVSGRRIRAHKCILRSRCQYFAAMLAGNGTTSQSIVTLPGYSYSAVHFALCHIYSGASHPPDGISLMELAALADLLGVEGLKEVTAHALKTNYCHNFHKPCSGCIDGILQVLPVALNHSLDDLYRKCLRWTCRHYLKVWPTRQFAQLPPDILGRCRQQIVAYLTSETVLDTVLDCDILISKLASFRWGAVCENLVHDIMDAAYSYIGDHFSSLIASDAFLSLGHDKCYHIPRLQEMLLRTAATLTPEQACRSYQRVTRLNTVLQARVIKVSANLGEMTKELQDLQDEELEWVPEYVRIVGAILSSVEQCLTRQCSRAMRITAWQRMDLDLRKKIQTLARLNEPIDVKRGVSSSKTIAKAFSFGGSNSSTRNQDLHHVKLAIQAHAKRALTQDMQLYKATQTQDVDCNVETAEHAVQASHELREGKVLKTNSRVHVPQQCRNSLSTTTSCQNRASINSHGRIQSETTSAHQTEQHQKQQETHHGSAKGRLTDVRPRYMEPRKLRGSTEAANGSARSATSGSIISTGKIRAPQHISSSDSSHRSSPSTRTKPVPANLSNITKSSVNMSMDSLASPPRCAKGLRSSTESERFPDVNSMMSSIKNDINRKTISQESLIRAGKLARSNPQIPSSNSNSHIKYNNSTSNRALRTTQQIIAKSQTSNFLKPQAKEPSKVQSKVLQHTKFTSASSSPASAVTTKSNTSRLSSVSSITSARDTYKNRSVSVTVAEDKNSPISQQQRHSFLSAKSREILAKRAEKEKQKQRAQQVNSSSDGKVPQQQLTAAAPLRSHSLTAVPSTRMPLGSHIPTRRPNSLHLRKNHPPRTANNNNKTTTAVVTTITGIRSRGASNHAYKPTATVGGSAVQQKIELSIGSPIKEKKHAKSKLERSSTFCKESSDLDLNELQIIE